VTLSRSGFDLVVIGAGPGGYTAAARAAELGMRVACVDEKWLGGTCLNAGCIPSKALLESSQRYAEIAQGMAAHGIAVGEVGLDLDAMMRRKEKIVSTMARGIAGLFKQRGVVHLSGTGCATGAGTVTVEGVDGREVLEARRTLLAMGGEPMALPALPFDGQHIITSAEALSLDRVPERIVVVGAGAIGLELGSVWARLGAGVRVVEFTDGILPGTDREIATQLQRLLKRQGMDFELSTQAAHAEVGDHEVELHLEGREGGESRVEVCDCVLVSAGRRPRTDSAGIQALGVRTDERGFVTVGEDYQTSVPGVYAIGDLIPGPMLAHVAEAEGVAAVEQMAGRPGRVNYAAIPAVVYTHPEVASVGLTEEEATSRDLSPVVGKHLFRANARAHCMDAIDGLVKVVGAADGRCVGVHVLGPQASHLIAEGVLALELGASAEDLARIVHAHPTLAEVVGEAARGARCQ